MRFQKKIIAVFATLMIQAFLTATLASGPSRPTAEFARHLDVLMPELLEKNHFVGASVALIQNGSVAYVHGYGFLNGDRKEPVTADTQFNVGSISKTLTAWGVMKLVEMGKIDLDAPVDKYLKRWHLPVSEFDSKGVTIRRLLSHTAGLSLSSVPEYPPSEKLPTLAEALSLANDKGVRQIVDPGTKFQYSGGGYMVLQLLIEDVSGQPFDEFMKNAVLNPLGMRSSTFVVTHGKAVATPYDKGQITQYFQYVGEAAASLYSTASDLGRFVAASVGTETAPRGGGVLNPETVALMESPAPASDGGYGTKAGLGYDLWPMGNRIDGEPSAGHQGQNTGWAGVFWTRPSTHDGIVILTNDSDGSLLYHVPMCDWAEWVYAPSFGRFCGQRSKEPGGTLHKPIATNGSVDPFVDSLFKSAFPVDGPGAAVALAIDGHVVHEQAYGLADLKTMDKIRFDTPFYLASLSKQFTATAILELVQEKRLSLDDHLKEFLPSLPDWASEVSVYNLLTHTSGIPDYYDLMEQQHLRPAAIDNRKVLELIREVHQLNFRPGSQFQYSNSGYVLLAMIVEHVVQMSFAKFLETSIFRPLGLTRTVLYDDSAPEIPGRAHGYSKSATGYTTNDYDAYEDEKGNIYRFKFTTSGAGGIYSNLEDLLKWDLALDTNRILSSVAIAQAYIPHIPVIENQGISGETGSGFGWFVTKRDGFNIIWHDGAKAGFHGINIRIPERKLDLIILSNLAQADLHPLAEKIIDHFIPDADKN